MQEEQSSRYFNINPDCFIVSGAKRGALYNLATGDVFSIDHISLSILKACERGVPLSRIIGDVKEVRADEIMQYLRKIGENKMGAFSDKSRRRKKVNLNRMYDKLDFMWLELREDCNLECIHCYCMCKPRTGVVDRLKHEDWLRLLEEGGEVEYETFSS